MPPLSRGDVADHNVQDVIVSSSDYGARTNHPTAYDDNPSFKGPLRLEQRESPDVYRNRIRNYYLDIGTIDNSLQANDNDDYLPTTLGASTPTKTILKSIVDHLAMRDAPVDAKEVAESMEFYLRCGKRLLGAARRVTQNKKCLDGREKNTITICDLCSGHGLTGLLFLACNPPGRIPNATINVVLVDQNEPKSHSILRDCIAEVVPWISSDTTTFVTSSLEDYDAHITNKPEAAGDASIIISTHACGSLTDMVLQHATEIEAASVAVTPCCYTGTDRDVPYGIRRMLGVGLSADVRRCFYMQGEFR